MLSPEPVDQFDLSACRDVIKNVPDIIRREMQRLLTLLTFRVPLMPLFVNLFHLLQKELSEHFLFKKVLATENVELTNKYGVKQAPTLVVLGQDGEFTKYKGVSEIKGMLTAKQVR